MKVDPSFKSFTANGRNEIPPPLKSIRSNSKDYVIKYYHSVAKVSLVTVTLLGIPWRIPLNLTKMPCHKENSSPGRNLVGTLSNLQELTQIYREPSLFSLVPPHNYGPIVLSIYFFIHFQRILHVPNLTALLHVVCS